MKSYNAKSRVDMAELASDLLRVPYKARPAMAANLMAEGVMLPSQWWVRLTMRLAKWRHKTDTYGAWAIVCARAPQIADDLIDQTAAWIRNGKDADGEGVGGLNQREVDTVVGMLSVLRTDA